MKAELENGGMMQSCLDIYGIPHGTNFCMFCRLMGKDIQFNSDEVHRDHDHIIHGLKLYHTIPERAELIAEIEGVPYIPDPYWDE